MGRGTDPRGGWKICLSCSLEQERQPGVDGYRFLAAADLAATATCFFCLSVLTLDCFCEVFFWFDFGDLSPIMLLGSTV